MDDPSLAPAALEHALQGLGRLNRISGAFGKTFGAVAREARAAARPLRLLDIACARGDFVLDAAKAAARTGLPIEMTGCDFNPQSISIARSRARELDIRCEFVQLDVLNGPLPAGFDIITASLFFHHLTEEQVITLLRNMQAAARIVVVNDLVRSPFNLLSVGVASRLLTRSPIVHTDAVLSARAAFTKSELLDLSRRAGLRDPTITSGGIARMMLVWRKAV